MSSTANHTSEQINLTLNALYMVLVIPLADDIVTVRELPPLSSDPYGQSSQDWQPYYFRYYDTSTPYDAYDAMTIDRLREVANAEWLEQEWSKTAKFQEIRRVDWECNESTAKILELLNVLTDKAEAIFILVADICGMVIKHLWEHHEAVTGLAKWVVYPHCVFRQPQKEIERLLRNLTLQNKYAGNITYPRNGHECKEAFLHILFAESYPQVVAHFHDAKGKAQRIRDYREWLAELDL